MAAEAPTPTTPSQSPATNVPAPVVTPTNVANQGQANDNTNNYKIPSFYSKPFLLALMIFVLAIIVTIFTTSILGVSSDSIDSNGLLITLAFTTWYVLKTKTILDKAIMKKVLIYYVIMSMLFQLALLFLFSRGLPVPIQAGGVVLAIMGTVTVGLVLYFGHNWAGKVVMKGIEKGELRRQKKLNKPR